MATNIKYMAKFDGWVPAHSTFGVVTVWSSGLKRRNGFARAVERLRQMLVSFPFEVFKFWNLSNIAMGVKV